MRIHLYSPVHFEKWDWRNSVEGGIGGSETCHVELASRFGKRGHEVISYSPLPEGEIPEYAGVEWKDLSDADFTEPGLWIIFRDARCLDEMTGENQTIWLLVKTNLQ